MQADHLLGDNSLSKGGVRGDILYPNFEYNLMDLHFSILLDFAQELEIGGGG